MIWRQLLRLHGERSERVFRRHGYDVAYERFNQISDALDALASEISRMRPKTMQGAAAKAEILASIEANEELAESVCLYDGSAKILAADLSRLAGRVAA